MPNHPCATRIITLLFCAGAMAVSAQNYPTRSIRIVTAEAGGGSDLPARVVAQNLSPVLGHPVVVDNRGGVLVVGEIVAKAAPDGYTLLFFGNSLWTLPLMRSKMNYDAAKDFTPITLAIVTPTMLVVHPSLPVNSVKDLVALAKSKPGQLLYSSAAAGTGNHLAAELFKSMTGTDMVRVAYKGHPSALNAVVSGEVQVFFPIVGPGIAQVNAGKLKALAVTTSQPTPLAPGLPTVAASGLPGYASVFQAGLFAPTGTPAAIISRLNREAVQILKRTDVKERLLSMGMEALGSSPQEFAAAIKNEVAVMGKVIKDAGIRDE